MSNKTIVIHDIEDLYNETQNGLFDKFKITVDQLNEILTAIFEVKKIPSPYNLEYYVE